MDGREKRKQNETRNRSRQIPRSMYIVLLAADLSVQVLNWMRPPSSVGLDFTSLVGSA